MTGRALRLGAFGCAGGVVVVGAAFPVAAGFAEWAAVFDAGFNALAPALGLVVVTRMSRASRLGAWAAFVGGLLTLALGVALYAAALGSARPGAVALAVAVVPLRQLVAVAVTAWAVWVTRGMRDEG